MSRIGKTPIVIPTEVTVLIAASNVEVKGPKGQLALTIPSGVTIAQTGQVVTVDLKTEGGRARALHGFVRAQLANMIEGVVKEWTKTLELSGVGYRAAIDGTNLILNVGYSHPVVITPPAGIVFGILEGKIVVSGIDKQMVGLTAARIRAVKEPEPYKGKGIKYMGEHIRKKAGKSAKSASGAGAK